MICNKRRVGLFLRATTILALTSVCVLAQGPAPGGPPESPKAGAPVEMTGYWVSVVVEDWKYRMLPPTKVELTPAGFFSGGLGVPLNAEGQKVALAWDPAKDEATGEQCRGYGAANIMRMPGRLHITWQDEQTLKIETDAGRQTRLLHFDAPKGPGGDWQGGSQASWETVAAFRVPGLGALSGVAIEKTGSLKVVTDKLKPGYLLRNGVPYSAKTVLTEYYDVAIEPDGDTYLLITTTVDDPVYLQQPYLTATHFKKQYDASGWNPTPCAAR